MIEVSKLDWKKKRFGYTDHKLTHPKIEVQGKASFILLVGERAFAESALPPPSTGPSEKEEKMKKKAEEKAKKQAEKKEKEAKKAKENEEKGGTLGKTSKVGETFSIETKAGIGNLF